MSKANDGWIKCTMSNYPPEGFRYDIRYADAVHVQSGNVSRGMMWSDRATRGGYWRPSEDATEESESSLLGNLISAADDHERTRSRCRSANEAIRDKMGERDRVIMRHDGDLYLVEWDDTETVSWVQIDEI